MREERRRRGSRPTHLGTLLTLAPLLLAQLGDPTEHADEHVRVDAALVRLVDNNDAVLGEEEVGGELAQEDAVGHEDELGVGRGGRRVADAVRDEGRVVGEPELVADASRGRKGGDSARLGDGDHARVVCERG